MTPIPCMWIRASTDRGPAAGQACDPTAQQARCTSALREPIIAIQAADLARLLMAIPLVAAGLDGRGAGSGVSGLPADGDVVCRAWSPVNSSASTRGTPPTTHST